MIIREILKDAKLQEFIRFCIVGVICTLIDAAVFYSLHVIYGYRFALICGFIMSVSVNYILNIKWSFKKKVTLKNAVGVMSAHCFNIFVVRMLLMWIMVEITNLTDGIAFVPTLGVSMIINFFVIRYIVNE